MIITRVRKLTAMNVEALAAVDIAHEIGTSYADFVGTPKEALEALQKALEAHYFDSTYHSLQAVRRKLNDAAAQYDAQSNATTLTPYVTVKEIEEVLPEPVTEIIDFAAVTEYLGATYQLTTIVPLVNEPRENVYKLNQTELNAFLSDYGDHAETIVELKRVREDH